MGTRDARALSGAQRMAQRARTAGAWLRWQCPEEAQQHRLSAVTHQTSSTQPKHEHECTSPPHGITERTKVCVSRLDTANIQPVRCPEPRNGKWGRTIVK